MQEHGYFLVETPSGLVVAVEGLADAQSLGAEVWGFADLADPAPEPEQVPTGQYL